MFLKQSTATTILIGPMVDSTDGATPETALDVTTFNADIYKGITKTDLTITASGGSNDSAHVANGFYSLELTTGNTDTLGDFAVTVNVTGALPVWKHFTVLAANVYDSLVAASDKLQVDTVQINGTNQTANDVGADAQAILTAIEGADELTLDVDGNVHANVQAMAANSLTASALATDAVSEIAAAVESGDSDIDEQLAAIKLQTDKIGSTNIIALERVISGKMILVKGEGRNFTFTEPSGSGWPSDLTGYTITFTADKEPLNVNTGDSTTGTIACSISPTTGTGRVITLPMTVAISDSMAVSRPGRPSYDFNIWAVNGSLVQEALVIGTVDVKDNVRL